MRKFFALPQFELFRFFSAFLNNKKPEKSSRYFKK